MIIIIISSSDNNNNDDMNDNFNRGKIDYAEIGHHLFLNSKSAPD